MNTHGDFGADILALNSSSEPVLLVEVKAHNRSGRAATRETEAAKRQIVGLLRDAGSSIPYVMLVDREQIQLLQWDGKELSEPSCQLSTPEILSAYDPEFGEKEIFGFYLETLVEAWLRDLAYQWKYDCPPGYAELAAVGLVQNLHGGTTVLQSAEAA